MVGGFAGTRDYRRGFIGAPRGHRFAEQRLLHGWNRILAQGFKFFVHPEMPLYRLDDALGHTILVLGDALVAHGKLNLDELLFRISAGDRSGLDDLTGRFALIVLTRHDGSIVHDPLGSQAIFRTLGPDPVVSSHASLIASCDGLNVSRPIAEYMSMEEYRAKVTRFLPGDLSLYKDVVHLVPNNELDLHTGESTRYWPKEGVRPSTFEGFISVWDEYFRSYVRFVSARYKPVIGLTGGLDSRAVIATVRSMGLDPLYITWDKMPDEEKERIPRLATHLGGKHAWVRMDERPQSEEIDEIRQAARVAAGLTRGTPLLPAQISQVIGAGDLFVKGLGGEVMRGPFNSRQKSHLPSDDYEGLAYALYAGQLRRSAGREYEETTRRAIRGYLERANYGDDLHGLDPGDLIYWEHRMGTWTAVQHAELSVVMNSHSAMNSRRIFTTAWGLPDEDRFGPGLLQRIIEHYDPKLAAL